MFCICFQFSSVFCLKIEISKSISHWLSMQYIFTRYFTRRAFKVLYFTPFCWSTKYPSQCLEKLSSFCGKTFSFVKSALCFFQARFVLCFWAITLSGGGIALAYINLFAFDISNNYDSALLELEVLLAVNCLQAIFVCFYLSKRLCHWRNRGNIPFWEWCCVRMVLLGWSHWEQQCTVSQQQSATQNPRPVSEPGVLFPGLIFLKLLPFFLLFPSWGKYKYYSKLRWYLGSLLLV